MSNYIINGLTIKEILSELAEKDYKKFSTSLNPGVENVIGIRVPKIRNLAKEIVKNNWHKYLETADTFYMEERMLQGLVIAYIKDIELDEKFKLLSDYIPKINSWSVCDTVCSTIKFSNKYKNQWWQFIKPYFNSYKEYEIRFGIVMTLNHFIDDEYINESIGLIDKINHEGYYVKMAIAWALSVCYIKYPKETMVYLNHNNLDNFTYNKALQKILESYRVSDTDKKIIHSMKK